MANAIATMPEEEFETVKGSLSGGRRKRSTRKTVKKSRKVSKKSKKSRKSRKSHSRR